MVRAFRVWRHLSSSLVSKNSLSRMAKLSVNVDITSDIVCPWCWIGKRQLDTAMEHLSSDFEFHVRWKPFLLNPFLPEQGIPFAEYCKLKFGEEAAQRFLSGSSPVMTQGRSLGINFTPNRLVVPTKKPHILLDYAETHGKQHELQEVLFKAYFSEGRNVSSDAVLKELAEEVGLDQDKAIAALSQSSYVRKFEEGIKETKTKGISSVPTFEFYVTSRPQVRQGFSGAQPVDTIIAVCSRLRNIAKM